MKGQLRGGIQLEMKWCSLSTLGRSCHGKRAEWSEVVYVAMGVPVAQGKFSGDWDVVLKLLELVVDVVLDVVCRWRWSPHNSGHVGGSTVVV